MIVNMFKSVCRWRNFLRFLPSSNAIISQTRNTKRRQRPAVFQFTPVQRVEHPCERLAHDIVHVFLAVKLPARFDPETAKKVFEEVRISRHIVANQLPQIFVVEVKPSRWKSSC